MEVTRRNFKDSLPLVEESIKAADFLVIDAEFTGLINGRDVSVFDTPQEYYLRLLSGISDFMLIQFGLCAFYWDEKSNNYKNDSYNFYLFPRGRPGPERLFLCQSSSLDFLSAQGFDFNKLIKEGISYMTEPTEAKLRENLVERQKLYSNEKDIITIPEENKPHIEEICNKVREFLDENKSNELELDRCNAFVRKLLFQELGTRFKKEVFLETKVLENKNRILKVSRITPDNISVDRELQKKEKEWEDFEEAVGFSKVARMISQSEKLVIGHNMLLDLLHTLSHFFQPLPSEYASFKEFAHCMFPRLLDTKYMSSLPPFKDKVNSSVLQHLLATLSEDPFKMPKVDSLPDRGYSQIDDKLHEAGFDAYITGLCFLAMHAHLASMRGEANARVTSDSAILKPFLNKLFLAKTAHQDSPFMNLAGNDPSPSRDHVFHLTFPKEYQRNDINQLFSPFGPITVQYLDDVSALVALARKEQARDALRVISKSSRVTLVPYNTYKQNSGKMPRDKQWRKPEEETLLTVSLPWLRQTDGQQSNSKRTATERVSPAVAATRSKQASNTSSNSSLPEKVDRAAFEATNESPSPSKTGRLRSQSMTSATATRANRKRTSSGVFEVDDAAPPPKKPEYSPAAESTNTSSKLVTNGRRKGKDAADPKSENDVPAKKVLEKFDSESTSKCVLAFKESDSWE